MEDHLTCLFCESKDFKEKEIPFPIENGTVMARAFVCQECGEPLMNSEQMDNLRKLERKIKNE